MRPRRRSGRVSNKAPIFWDRGEQDLQLTNVGGASSPLFASVIGDPSVFLNTPVDVEYTLRRCKLFYESEHQLLVAAGFTSVNSRIHHGLYVADAGAAIVSPKLNTLAGTQVDWLDLWDDVLTMGSAVATGTRLPLNVTSNRGWMNFRDVKAQRRIGTNQQLLWVAEFAAFPPGAAVGGTWVMNMQCTFSLLWNESKPRR